MKIRNPYGAQIITIIRFDCNKFRNSVSNVAYYERMYVANTLCCIILFPLTELGNVRVQSNFEHIIYL